MESGSWFAELTPGVRDFLFKSLLLSKKNIIPGSTEGFVPSVVYVFERGVLKNPKGTPRPIE